MSVYATFDAEAGDQVASNKGWGDFVRWASALRKPALNDLIEDGETTQIRQVIADLEEALHQSPPASETIEDTVRGLLRLLRINIDQEILLITDGTGPSVEGDEDEEESDEPSED